MMIFRLFASHKSSNKTSIKQNNMSAQFQVEPIPFENIFDDTSLEMEVEHTEVLFPSRSSICAKLDRNTSVPAVPAIVNDCYQRIIQDQYLEFFFRGFDFEANKVYIQNFFEIALMVGRDSDELDDLIDSFQTVVFDNHFRMFDLGMKEGHFDLILGHLVISMKELNVNEAVVHDVVRIIAQFRQVFEAGSTEAKLKQVNARHALTL